MIEDYEEFVAWTLLKLRRYFGDWWMRRFESVQDWRWWWLKVIEILVTGIFVIIFHWLLATMMIQKFFVWFYVCRFLMSEDWWRLCWSLWRFEKNRWWIYGAEDELKRMNCERVKVLDWRWRWVELHRERSKTKSLLLVLLHVSSPIQFFLLASCWYSDRFWCDSVFSLVNWCWFSFDAGRSAGF